jgi:hypothetical protein
MKNREKSLEIYFLPLTVTGQMSEIRTSLIGLKMVWALIGTLLVLFGVLSIAVGTFVPMKKFTASSTIHFNIHLYENYPQKQKWALYPWYVTITAHLLRTGYTRAIIKIERNWGDFKTFIIDFKSRSRYNNCIASKI